MNPMNEMSRRAMLRSAACGFGYLAFAGLASEVAAAAESASYQNPLAPRTPHFAPRAKRVIFMFMQGGPSHLDTFDHKPSLDKMDGERSGNRQYFASPFKFNRHGSSGLPISELYPHLAQHADDLCMLNGMHTDNPAHPQATIMLHTGSSLFVRPSIGSWVLYGLGTVNQNLPGFVTINPLSRLGGAQNYGSAFLPAAYQGMKLGSDGRDGDDGALPNLKNPSLAAPLQRRQLDLVQSMNRDLLQRQGVNTEIEGVIESFELAFKMQATVPDVLDIRGESQATLDSYGIGKGATDRFGMQCLMARRFAEAGVRFIEVTHTGWDHHNNLNKRLSANAQATDQPIAALLTDLKQRGMLEDTLLVWGGEFGRTPYGQGRDGRNHNNRGYTMWLAGGGVKGGLRFGATDDTGYEAVENKVHTHDLHATILHLLGLDHEKLTYRYSGRDFRLTDVHGVVPREILA